MNYLKKRRSYHITKLDRHMKRHIAVSNVGYVRCDMLNTYPFSVFKRKDRPNYLVAFKDDEGNYLPAISTGKKNEDEAKVIAFKWLKDGIPKKNNAVLIDDLAMRNLAIKVNNDVQAEILVFELKRLGWLKSYVLKETPQAQDFLAFLKTFWDWDTSPYIQEKLRKNHGIHKRHCKLQGQAIKQYWEPYFQGRCLGDITASDIDEFITEMGKKDLSAARKNVVIKAGTRPLRWAFIKRKIDKDPTLGHILFSGKDRKRHILSPIAVAAMFRVPWSDNRAKNANMLAAVTGMRSGEILALRVQDLGNDCIFVNGSWNREDGLKLPKNNNTRRIETPFPNLLENLLEQAKQNPWGVSPDSFVFWSEFRNDRPMESNLFVYGLRDALKKINFNDDEAKKYIFHGWRHFYTSYMIKKLDKKLVKLQTGHLSDEMIELYGDHETQGERDLIIAKEREVFAGLLPEKVLQLEDKREIEIA